MGSLIRLAVGNFEVDWGKNTFFHDHGPLFQSRDIQPVLYHYVGAHGKQIVEEKDAFVRPLNELLPRLELLGHTLAGARREFESLGDLSVFASKITFDQLAAALKGLDANKVSSDYSRDHAFGEFFSEEIFDRLAIGKAVEGDNWHSDATSELMENLHPWDILRLLAENPANLRSSVTWYFSDVVEGGWVDQASIRPSLSTSHRFLIVTEGSSDAKILKRALELMRPDVSDFFYFVDMEEGYPFTGTGNLHRFCQGLASIQILNRVLVIFDNDADGLARSAETQTLKLPNNMRVVRLPNLRAFEAFPTLGPSGESLENINGRAAALECYLDLRWKEEKKPVIRWTSYNEKLQCYQGALLGKESYTRRFLNLTGVEPGYDFGPLTHVLDMIMKECVGMAGECFSE